MGGRLAIMVALLGACSFDGSGPAVARDGGTNDGAQAGDGGPDAAPAENWLAGYQFRKRITFAPTGLSAPVSDFPVAVNLTSDAEIASASLTGVNEVAFTEQDGDTVVAFEIEQFDSNTGALAAWVHLEQLPVAGTAVYLYFGHAVPMPRQDRAGTFVGPFASVWHLSDDPQGLAPQFADSVSGNDGTSVGAQDPLLVDGVVGSGLELGGTGYEVSFGDPGDGSLDFDQPSFSFSTWVNVTTSESEFDFPMWKGGTAESNPGYGLTAGTGEWRVGVSDGTAAGNLSIAFGDEADYLGRWVQLVAVVDRPADELRMYSDGAIQVTLDIGTTGSLSTNRSLSIGQAFAPYQGQIDEMRVYDEAVTADWIRAEHDNLLVPSFVVVGAVESAN